MKRLQKIRIVLQLFFFTLFIIGFYLLNRFPIAYRFESRSFLQINPLVGVIVCCAARTLVLPLAIYGTAMAIATVVAGRFFCGMICPLGSLIDFSDRFFTRRMRHSSRRPPRWLQRLKYVILVGLLICALLGSVWPLFFDPISLLTRLFTLAVTPLMWLVGSVGTELLEPIWPNAGSFSWGGIRLFYGGLGAAVLVGAILIAGFWDRRFWCQYLCPSGAFFALLGQKSFFRRVVQVDKCNRCTLCVRQCPTRAIDESDPVSTRIAECIECGLCTAVRKVDCGRFELTIKRNGLYRGPDLSRRHVIAGLAGGAAVLPALRTDAMIKRDNTGRLIRPPGSIPELDFAARCLGCGQCMKACPTNAIQPCMLSDGFGRLFTPRIVPRIGACEEKCYLCGHVCPTGAIRPLSYEQKSFAKIGTAVIDRHRCLPWAQNKECLVCDEVCPYNAIVPAMVETTKGIFKVPVVYEDLCMGCGYCEHHCPINDTAAIVVFRFGENRIRNGEYLSEWQKQRMKEIRQRSDSGIFQTHDSAFSPHTSAHGVLPLKQSLADEHQLQEKEKGKEGVGERPSLPPGFLE